MALRVLLADESTTIKKVFQLALQDYATEVTTVNLGSDVEQVALKNKPDIVFADVLLQKRSGYDVCQDIKSNPQLANIPVVLIWSGFMELDKGRYTQCGADAHLEKPFDSATLRKIVQTFVAKTKTQPLSDFMQFPKLPDFVEKKAPALENKNIESSQPKTNPNWSMDDFAKIEEISLASSPENHELDSRDEADEFVPLNLPKAPQSPKVSLNRTTITQEEPAESQTDWVQKTLSQYKIDPKLSEDEIPTVKFDMPHGMSNDEDIFELDLGGDTSSTINKLPNRDTPITSKKNLPPAQFTSPPLAREVSSGAANATPNPSISPAPKQAPVPQLDAVQLEAVLRAQSKEIIEKVVWQVVPEIATRIIERELEKLLKERSRR